MSGTKNKNEGGVISEENALREDEVIIKGRKREGERVVEEMKSSRKEWDDSARDRGVDKKNS